MSELSSEQKRELKLNGGVLIEDIRGGALRTNLRPGDIVLALIAHGESNEIRSVEQFNRLLARLDKAANVSLLVKRGDVQTFVTIKGVPERKGD